MLCPSHNLFLLKLAYMITLDYGENMETFCGKCGDAAAKKNVCYRTVSAI